MLSPTTSLSPIVSPEAKLPAELNRSGEASLKEARELKKNFTQFVGETFFGQMLKSMRATVGEPAYFHGGHAEEQFQARLDQQLAQDMASAGASGLAEQMFESQFPHEARQLKESIASQPSALDALAALPRR